LLWTEFLFLILGLRPGYIPVHNDMNDICVGRIVVDIFKLSFLNMDSSDLVAPLWSDPDHWPHMGQRPWLRKGQFGPYATQIFPSQNIISEYKAVGYRNRSARCLQTHTDNDCS
jgi:hypothetical protein